MPNSKKKPAKQSILKRYSPRKTLLICLVVSSILVGLGYVAKQQLMQRHLKAEAYGWSTLYYSNGIKVSACKVTQWTIYGNIRRVKFVVNRGSNYQAHHFTVSATISRNDRVVDFLDHKEFGPYVLIEGTAVAGFNDKFNISLASNFKSIFSSGARNPAYLSDC